MNIDCLARIYELSCYAQAKLKVGPEAQAVLKKWLINQVNHIDNIHPMDSYIAMKPFNGQNYFSVVFGPDNAPINRINSEIVLKLENSLNTLVASDENLKQLLSLEFEPITIRIPAGEYKPINPAVSNKRYVRTDL